jgi:cellulose synthase/poly-beta-1,6-N-acetylglucosamine synthase-like glycosyltransferase
MWRYFFAAFNEINVIEDKLKSIVATSYPIEKLKVFVGSDNSTDGTNEKLLQYEALYPSLIFFKNFEGRNGKILIINTLVSDYKKNSNQAELLVFTDANVMFTPDMFFSSCQTF